MARKSLHRQLSSSRTPPKTLRAILYDIVIQGQKRSLTDQRAHESHQLIHTYGGTTIETVIQRRHHYSTWGFIGYHKLLTIIELAYQNQANLILINQALKPKQIYNLEDTLATYAQKQRMPPTLHIWDRVDLIINIFSQHAHTAEARLQLELARLEHFGPRIYGMGGDLSQQGGGIGTRGLGETNTEIMKRHLAHRKKLLRKKLTTLTQTRSRHRSRRTKNGFKAIALVGYTNTGKSALFQALSGKKAYVEDELFATLHTLTARMPVDNFMPTPIILSDTIGFIEELPPKLIEAFRSTLEDTLEADMLLHVVDVSDPHFRKKVKIVQNILKDLDAHTLPSILVFNKIDKLLPHDPLHAPAAQLALASSNSIFVSARSGHNIPLLKKTLLQFFTSPHPQIVFPPPPSLPQQASPPAHPSWLSNHP